MLLSILKMTTLTDGFKDRLIQALDLRNFPPMGKGRVAAVQELFSLSRAGATKWLHGKSFPHKKKRCEVAEKLGVNLLWLETGNGGPLDVDSRFEASSLIQEIPHKALNHLHENSNDQVYASAYLPTDVFAITYVGDSMFPKFQSENILIISPSDVPQDGDYVLAKSSLLPEAVIRQYIIGSGNQYLVALNPKFGPTIIDDAVSILGKVVEVRAKL